jgi:pyruvate kinase
MPIVIDSELLQIRRTKIVATVGPASEDAATLTELVKAGVNVFRLNMSHGEHKSHSEAFHRIKAIAEEQDAQVGILVDLCGPKIRTGKFQDGEIMLQTGEQLSVTTRDVLGKPGLIPSQYQSLADDVNVGDRVLLNDGIMELKVDAIEGTEISCTVIQGGVLKNNKGINLPGVEVSAPSLTEKDIVDARFAIELGADYLALSFVRRASDVEALQKVIKQANANTAIIAKIEKPEALLEIDKILEVADAIMVARGDLGVELRPEQVPVAQSQLIRRARQKYKPVIVATQMLESMIENPRPTRAEVTDISYAVSLEADAVMLSAESAAGAFPVESVVMMNSIIRQTEAHLWETGAYASGLHIRQQPPIPIWDAVSNRVNDMAHDLQVKAIVVVSKSGMSAATLVAARPAAPVIAITSSPEVCHRLALMWSIIPVLVEQAGTTDPNKIAREVAKDLKLAKEGQYIISVRGFHGEPKLNAPTITVLAV